MFSQDLVLSLVAFWAGAVRAGSKPSSYLHAEGQESILETLLSRAWNKLQLDPRVVTDLWTIWPRPWSYLQFAHGLCKPGYTEPEEQVGPGHFAHTDFPGFKIPVTGGLDDLARLPSMCSSVVPGSPVVPL